MKSLFRHLGLVFLAVLHGATPAQPSRAPPSAAWQEAAPAEQGVDAALLDRLRERLRGADAAMVRSVLLLKNDRIVFEHYRPGIERDTLHQVNSVTKSVTSALVGIALEKKLIASLDQKIGDWLPEASAPGVDPRVKDITVRQLLTFTAGFDWDEEARDKCNRAPGADCSTYDTRGDPVAFALRRPLAHAPGTRFRYDSWSSHLLSAILTRATGMSAGRFAQQELAALMGIGTLRWPSDAQGNSFGGFGLQATTRDMAKFGSLYLHRGAWQGRQLVPAAYVEASTRQQVQAGWPLGSWAGYGYQWWILSQRGGGIAYSAIGSGGQYVYVLPALDAVIVVTSEPRGTADTSFLLREFLLPALQRKP